MEYFELEAQPLTKTVYTPNLAQQRKNKTPYKKLCNPKFRGTTIHTSRARLIADTGANVYKLKLDVEGYVDSLVNSLIASANG
jgi:hypothetical protein